MRAVVALLALVVIVAPFAAAADPNCGALPTLDPFAPNTCAGYRACDAQLCSCFGVTNGTSATQCFAAVSSSVGCTNAAACVAKYFMCLAALDAARLNTSDSCAAFGTVMHNAILQSASTNFTNSSMQQSCNANACRLANQSSWIGTCADAGKVVCSAALIPLAPGTVYDIVATFRLSGANWSAVLGDPAKLAALKTSLTTDIAAFIKVLPTFIVILDLLIGSLVVNFAVIQGSGKSISELSTSVSASTASTSWLTSVQAVYSQVGTDSVAVTSASVTVTAAPTTAPSGTTSAPSGSTSAPTPSSPVGVPSGNAASFTSVVVAVAAAVAALLL